MIYVVTMGFVPSRIWRQSCAAFYRTSERKVEHVFVDQHYPLNHDSNREENWNVCRMYGITVLDPGRNLGGTEGFNYALERLPLKPDDVVIGYDPDSYPITPGWDGALADAIALDPRIVWTSLMSARAKPELEARGYERRHLNQLEVWRTKQPVVNSVCAFRASWLKAVGGLSQPSKWYGGLECSLWAALGASEWCFLPGWWEWDDIRDQQDREYLWYKWKHAHLKEWPGDFASYCLAGCPPPSDLPGRLP